MSCAEGDCPLPDWFQFAKLVIEEKIRILMKQSVRFGKNEILAHVTLSLKIFLDLGKDQIVTHFYKNCVSVRCLNSDCGNCVVFEVDIE